MIFLAQITGLREDPIPPFSGTGGALGFAAVFQMLLALAIVLLIVRWLVPKYLTRFTGKATTPLGGELLVEEAANVQGGRILLVKARGRSLLIGAGQNGFSMLADLTEEPDELQIPPSGRLAEPVTDANFDRMLERLQRLNG